jgi:hypothetical protein
VDSVHRCTEAAPRLSCSLDAPRKPPYRVSERCGTRPEPRLCNVGLSHVFTLGGHKMAGLPLHNATLFGIVDGPQVRLSALHAKVRSR